ncbi:hypothetical protein H8957_012337 [Semnopithecus entellus]
MGSTMSLASASNHKTSSPPSAQQPPLLPPPPSFPPRPTTAQAQRLAPPCAAAARASRALAAHAPRARALTESWRARARLPRVSSGIFAAAALGAESLRSRAAVESQLKEAQGAGEARSWTFSLPHLRDPHALRRGNDRHAVTVGRCSRELRVSRVPGRAGAGAVKGSRAGKARYPAPSAPTPPPRSWSWPRACGLDPEGGGRLQSWAARKLPAGAELRGDGL